jgi:hypothetical protein
MPDNPLPSSVEFNYVKSSYFRIIHVNGAFGGFSPDGNLFMAVFSERPALPDVTVQAVGSSGQLGTELLEQRKITEKGIVRELEAGLAMDVRTARAIIQWLKERIDLAEKLAAETQQKSEVKL